MVMEEASVLGFNSNNNDEKTSCTNGEEEDDAVAVGGGGGYKLVPWLTWDEWDFVRHSFFFFSSPTSTSSSSSISSALHRVTAWQSRGCLPVIVQITASLIEIQQIDPFFRNDNYNNAIESEEMLSMLYCMAIMRLVNAVIEKTRKKTETSIAEAAIAINLPRMLIDIRHEGSHRDLPSLRLLRIASIKALDWLKSYYWEPQKKAIQQQSDGASRIRKEIKFRLCELAFCLKAKLVTLSGSPANEKCSKKQISKLLKNLVRLYFSYSLELASVLVEVLLKGSGFSDYNVFGDHSSDQKQRVFDYWKPAITKLSRKEPDLLLNLIKIVHKMIETEVDLKYGSGELTILDNTAKASHVNRLLDLIAWLISILDGIKVVHRIKSAGAKEGSKTGTRLLKATLAELLHSLLISCRSNKQLKCSALALANMTGNNSLVEKLNKLFTISALNLEFDEENSCAKSSENIFAQHEEAICQAAKNLELLKHSKLKSKAAENVLPADEKRWPVATLWNKCPIGMLPNAISSSARLPVLDIHKGHGQDLEPSADKENVLGEEKNLKRKSDCEVDFLNDSVAKKARVIQKDEEGDSFWKGVQGKLMFNGVWKKVEKQELLAISAGVRLLV